MKYPLIIAEGWDLVFYNDVAGDPFVFEEKHIVDWLIIYEDG